MTFPSVVSDLLMLAPSLSLAPRAPVLSARSLPAKSTRLILLTCVNTQTHTQTDRQTTSPARPHWHTVNAVHDVLFGRSVAIIFTACFSDWLPDDVTPAV